MGTKDGVPLTEEEVKVCEDCYDILKDKVKTRSRLRDLTKRYSKANIPGTMSSLGSGMK